jgi:hypothetical protein
VGEGGGCARRSIFEETVWSLAQLAFTPFPEHVYHPAADKRDKSLVLDRESCLSLALVLPFALPFVKVIGNRWFGTFGLYEDRFMKSAHHVFASSLPRWGHKMRQNPL